MGDPMRCPECSAVIPDPEKIGEQIAPCPDCGKAWLIDGICNSPSGECRFFFVDPKPISQQRWTSKEEQAYKGLYTVAALKKAVNWLATRLQLSFTMTPELISLAHPPGELSPRLPFTAGTMRLQIEAKQPNWQGTRLGYDSPEWEHITLLLHVLTTDAQERRDSGPPGKPI